MPPNVYPSGISNDAVWCPFIEPRIMCAPCGRFQGKREPQPLYWTWCHRVDRKIR